MRQINELIWHCSATPAGEWFTVEDIDEWHKARGWNGIGYHYVVYLDGSIHEGRPVEEIGAHVEGHNEGTIGACYIGGVDANKAPLDTRTAQQRPAMERLTRDLIARHGLTKVSGHYQYANRACPCFDAEAEYSYLIGGNAVIAPRMIIPSRWPGSPTKGEVIKKGARINIDRWETYKIRHAVMKDDDGVEWFIPEKELG